MPALSETSPHAPTAKRTPRRYGLWFGTVLAVFAAGQAGCAQSCQKTAGPVAARDDMAMVPKETDIVFMANLTRARTAPMWKKVTDALNKDATSKQQYDEFVAKCKLDPLKQLDSAFLALPQNADQNREFALVLRGALNSANLIACIRQTAKEKAGKELVETVYQNHKLYSADGQDGVFTSLSDKVAVLAGKEWVKKVVDLYDNRTPGDGAKDHKELSDLVKRTLTGDAFWGAGLVPASVSEKLKSNPQLGSAASLKSVFGSLDFVKGLLLHLSLDLGTDQDATDTSTKVKEQLAVARKNPNVMLMGMSRYFDTIKVESQKNTFATVIDLNQQQVDDLSAQLSGLLASGLLGGRPGGLPVAPPPDVKLDIRPDVKTDAKPDPKTDIKPGVADPAGKE